MLASRDSRLPIRRRLLTIAVSVSLLTGSLATGWPSAGPDTVRALSRERRHQPSCYDGGQQHARRDLHRHDSTMEFVQAAASDTT